MRVSINLVLVVIALWLIASMFEGCRNRPKPFQDWMKRRQQRIDDRRKMPEPIDDEDDQERRRWMFRDRKRLFPINEAYPCET